MEYMVSPQALDPGQLGVYDGDWRGLEVAALRLAEPVGVAASFWAKTRRLSEPPASVLIDRRRSLR